MLLELFEDAGGATGTPQFCQDTCRHQCMLEAWGRNRAVVQHYQYLTVLQGTARKEAKALGESPQDPVYLQWFYFEPSGWGGSQLHCHTLEANPTAMSSTTQVKSSCPNPSFLETQCYRCFPIVFPLMPCLDVVYIVPCILLENLLSAFAPSHVCCWLSYSQPCFRLLKPISYHHQPPGESIGAKVYAFGGSSCPIMTMGAAAPLRASCPTNAVL